MTNTVVPHRSTVADIQRKLSRGDLEPLRALLARILDCEPDAESLRLWTVRHPDRWVSMVAAIGRLSGIAEVHEHRHVAKSIDDMSDAEIAERLDKVAQRVKGELGSMDPRAPQARRIDLQHALPAIIDGELAHESNGVTWLDGDAPLRSMFDGVQPCLDATFGT